MTLSFDQMLRTGPFRVVALTNATVTASHTKKAVSVFGCKSPVAVLVRQGATLKAFRPDGAPMSKDDIEKLYPGAWDRVLAEA